jgi:hypothetical protein
MRRASPEHKIQVALMDYLALALRPELEARAVPNGEKRHISVASRLKAEGVKPRHARHFHLSARRAGWPGWR